MSATVPPELDAPGTVGGRGGWGCGGRDSGSGSSSGGHGSECAWRGQSLGCGSDCARRDRGSGSDCARASRGRSGAGSGSGSGSGCGRTTSSAPSHRATREAPRREACSG